MDATKHRKKRYRLKRLKECISSSTDFESSDHSDSCELMDCDEHTSTSLDRVMVAKIPADEPHSIDDTTDSEINSGYSSENPSIHDCNEIQPENLGKNQDITTGVASKLANLVLKYDLSRDYVMHLLFEGITKRILSYLMDSSYHSKVRLSSTQKKEIDARLNDIYIPYEFSRKARSLSLVPKWKATELRLFLLYTGPIVLRDFLPPDVWLHFVELGISTRYLCNSKKMSPSRASKLKKELEVWVCRSRLLYGQTFPVYNVHMLPHLVDDHLTFGNLMQVSAFPFENFMRQLKKMSPNGTNPLISVGKKLHLLKPRIQTKVDPKIRVGTYVLVPNFVCKIDSVVDDQNFVGEMYPLSEMEPLVMSRETCCRLLNLYRMPANKRGIVKARISKFDNVLLKFLDAEVDGFINLMAMSKDLFN